ncbi:LysR substrate-binding domain-containing protein [Thalassotalea fusca]
MIDDLKPMAVFVETIEQGSFRGAAEKLGLSPSVISHHISMLEKRLDCTLLYRSTRKLSLTDEGHVLFEHAQQMMQFAKSGLSKVSPKTDNPFGKLTLSVPTLLARSIFSSHLADFMAKFPNITLNIQCTDERINIIEHGIDVAVRLGTMQDSSLKALKVGEIARVLVCAPALIKQFGSPTHPTELSNWPWLSLAMLKDSRRLIRYKGDSTHVIDECEVSFVGKHTINSVDYLSRLCECGAGVATPPLFMVDSLIRAGELVQLLPTWQVAPIDVHLVWPNNALPTSLSRLFIDFIKAKPMNV